MPDFSVPACTSFDWPALLAKLEGDETFARTLLGIAQRTSAAMPVDLRAAGLAGDFDAMARIAHKMKGTAGDICAARLREHAAAAELAARQSSPDAAGRSRELADAVQALLDELQAVATSGA